MKKFLNTTQHNVIWFKNAHDNGTLDMSPPFQRNPVWVNRQKSFLIDSMLNGYPIPEIYMQEEVSSKGIAKYTVVDGQQRMRSVLEFLEDRFELDPTDSPQRGGMSFDDLSDEDKKKIYEYDFIIRVLPSMDNEMIRAIFQRLNRNVVALNAQELRHATYWGPFITLMNNISDKPTWSNIDLFTPNDVRRMIDVEYISELTIAIINGPQNKKQNLEKYYELYEQEFDDAKYIDSMFNKILEELSLIIPESKRSRWRKKTDFYTLFLCFANHENMLPLTKGGRILARSKLCSFEEEIQIIMKSSDVKKEKVSVDTIHYGSGMRATTDLSSRNRRSEALENVLNDIWKE